MMSTFGVAIARRLQVDRINGHHLDRRSGMRLRRH
jgi:hypothetical protein